MRQNPALFQAVQLEISRIRTRVSSAKLRAERASSLRELRQLSHIPIPPHLSALRHEVPDLRRLERAVQSRATELVEGHLEELRSLKESGNAQLFKRRLGQLLTNEWIYLRGSHPALLQKAERESRVLHVEMHAHDEPDPDAPAGVSSPERPR